MPKVIIFNGPTGCGKDTCRKFLMEKHPDVFGSLRMSKSLKDGIHTLLGLPVYEEEYASCKNAPHPDFFGKVPRSVYIHGAEYFLKVLFGEDVMGHIWLRLYKNLYAADQEQMIIIADGGFGPEMEPLINHFGADQIWLFRIFMQGCDFSQDSRGYVYGVVPFEKEIVNIPGQPQRMLQQLEYLLTVNKLYTEFYNAAE